MKAIHLVAVGVLAGGVVLASVPAGAQQRPQPIPSGSDTGSGSGGHHRNPAPRMTFPMTPGRYEIYLQKMLDMIRKAAGHGGVTAGDVNKIILESKECAASIESDGVVTASEFERCNRILDKLQEHEPSR